MRRSIGEPRGSCPARAASSPCRSCVAWWLVLVVVLAALVLTSCGGDGTDTGSSATPDAADTGTRGTGGTAPDSATALPSAPPTWVAVTTSEPSSSVATAPTSTTWGVTDGQPTSISDDLVTACAPVPAAVRTPIGCP